MAEASARLIDGKVYAERVRAQARGKARNSGRGKTPKKRGAPAGQSA
jgi:hypothetical protein